MKWSAIARNEHFRTATEVIRKKHPTLQKLVVVAPLDMYVRERLAARKVFNNPNDLRCDGFDGTIRRTVKNATIGMKRFAEIIVEVTELYTLEDDIGG
mmetsp:Transcript_5732/g.14687  ORF Transcript_5732/g.14687 Transcript_5732/m.14687 type:complete len:98 (+) Transcript_5732:27-320(+)